MLSIVTYYNDACLPYAQLSDISKMKYSSKWGYPYYVHTQPFTDREPHWNKFPAVLQHFQDSDYIMWMDADAFIVNQDFDVGTLFGDKDIYMSKDCHGWNNGVFAVKTSNISREFLNDCINAYPQFRRARFKQQSCMGYFMDTKYKQYVQQVPVRTWNSYDDIYGGPDNLDNPYHDGDFILHLPDQRTLNRIKPNYRTVRFGELLKRML